MTAVRLTDTSLRDGSHAVAHRFTADDVSAIAGALDRAGVPVIEVTHGDGLGGSSFNYGFSLVPEIELIAVAAATVEHARIAVLLLPGVGTVDDLRAAVDAGATVARIATHSTEADVARQHFGVARSLEMEPVGFLMLAHMTSPAALAEQARVMATPEPHASTSSTRQGRCCRTRSRPGHGAPGRLGDQAEVGFHGHRTSPSASRTRSSPSSTVRCRSTAASAASVRRGQRAHRGPGGGLRPLGSTPAWRSPRFWQPPTRWSAR